MPRHYRNIPLARREKRRSAPLKAPGFSGEKPATARVIGYARVSTAEQNLGMQLTMLKEAKVDDLFMEKISAADAKRPMFNLALKYLEPGDTLVVYSFSRIFRDLKKILIFVDDMKAKGVTLKSLTEPHIDPFTTNGRLLLSVTGAVDENERGRVRDRTRHGMAELKRKGMYIGRPRKISDDDIEEMKRLRRAGQHTAKQIAARFNIATATFYNVT